MCVCVCVCVCFYLYVVACRFFVYYFVSGIEMPIPELELVFFKVIGIGENVIAIFNYCSATFPVISPNFLTKIYKI